MVNKVGIIFIAINAFCAGAAACMAFVIYDNGYADLALGPLLSFVANACMVVVWYLKLTSENA